MNLVRKPLPKNRLVTCVVVACGMGGLAFAEGPGVSAEPANLQSVARAPTLVSALSETGTSSVHECTTELEANRTSHETPDSMVKDLPPPIFRSFTNLIGRADAKRAKAGAPGPEAISNARDAELAEFMRAPTAEEIAARAAARARPGGIPMFSASGVEFAAEPQNDDQQAKPGRTR